MASNTAEEEEELTVPTTTTEEEDYEALFSTTDVELLKRAWRNEKAAPEILRFQSDLINRVTEQIQLMEETVEEKSADNADPLSLSLYQMDLDRTLCTGDLKKHLEENVLSQLPENYQSILRQSVISEEDDMENSDICGLIMFLASLPISLILSTLQNLEPCCYTDNFPEPQLDTFVLCRSKEYLTGIQLEDGPVDDRQFPYPCMNLYEASRGALPKRIWKCKHVGIVSLIHRFIHSFIWLPVIQKSPSSDALQANTNTKASIQKQPRFR
ncbi:hypothetical protein RIF29_39329 [Crotalaria pallida]|uniref:Uncharacterized protein n=1 Tax=Crotalaria pallida TaxID=3830 RepID=A0AAN9E1V7_CROPI